MPLRSVPPTRSVPPIRSGRRRALGTALLAALLLLATLAAPAASAGPSVSAAPNPACAWMNTRLSADQRATLLLRASTLGQKLRWLDEQAANSPTQTTFSVAASRSGLTARFRVTNTGRVAGTETAQAYLTLPAATGEPGRRLVCFGQVALRPGESRTVTFRVDARSADHPLSYWSTTAHAWAVAPGTYRLAVGPSSQTLPLGRSFLLG